MSLCFLAQCVGLYSLRQDPTPRATACLALAMHGHGEMEKLARQVLPEVEEDSSDEMALKLALYHFGDRKMWPEGVFEVWCGFLGRSALAILVKQGDREALDRIITKATEHPHAAIREEAVLAVEQITGKRWYQRQENERAEWHAKEIREWWKEAGEDWPGTGAPGRED